MVRASPSAGRRSWPWRRRGRRRPRRPWRRTLLRGAAALGIAALALLLLLHTPFGRGLARTAAETAARRALGIPVALASLDCSLWRGECGLSDVTLPFGEATVTAKRVDIGWSARAGAEARLLQPVVTVRDSGKPSPPGPPVSGLAAQPWRVLERFSRFDVADGRVELQDERGEPWLLLGRVAARMEERSGRRTLVVAVPEVSIGWPAAGLRLQGATAEAEIAFGGGSLSVERCRVSHRGSTLDLRGALARVSPFEAQTNLHASLAGDFVTRLAPGAVLEGGIDADLALVWARETLQGTVNARASALTVHGVGPWSVDVAGRLDGPVLQVESAQARGFGGRVSLAGPLALGPDARTDARLAAEGLDPAALVHALSQARIPLRSRMSGSLRWTAQGWDVESGRGEGRIELRAAQGAGLKLAGATGLRVAGAALALSGARFEARSARLTGDAELSRDGALGGRWSAELPLAALQGLLADLGVAAPLPALEGRLLAEGEVSGRRAQPVASARVRSDGLTAWGHPLALDADAGYADGKLALAPLVVRPRSGQARFSGTVPVLANAEWSLEGDIDSLDIAPILASAGRAGQASPTGQASVAGQASSAGLAGAVSGASSASPAASASVTGSESVASEGSVSGRVTISGARDDPQGRASLHATLMPAEAPEPVLLEIEAHTAGKRVTADRIQAQVAGGSLEGSLEFDAATQALACKAKAEGLTLARLPFVPAPLRRLDGTLAGEIALTGTTQAPAGQAELRLVEVALEGRSLPALSLRAEADGRALRLTGRADAVFVEGSAQFEGDWPMSARVDLAAIPLQAVLDALPSPKDSRPEITAAGTLELELPLRAPSRVRYSGAGLSASGRFRELAWRIEPFSARGDSQEVEVEGLRLESGKSRLSAKGRVPLAPVATFGLAIDGHLEAADLHPALPGHDFGGSGELKLELAGLREAPELAGDLQLAGVAGEWAGARVDDLSLTARFDGPRLSVERLHAKLLDGQVSASGSWPLRRIGAKGTARLGFEIEDLDLVRLLGREESPQAEAAELRISANGELLADAPDVAGLQARGRITRLASRSTAGELLLEAPAEWALASGRIELQPLRLRGSPGTLEARAEARLLGPSAGWSATLRGDADLRVLNPFLPGVTLGGAAAIDATVSRGAKDWRVDGRLNTKAARLSLDELNFVATQIDTDIRFEGDRLSLAASAVAGDGRLQASGGIRFGPSLLGPTELTLTADRVPLSYPPGFHGRTTGELRLTGSAEEFRIEGDVALSQAYYTAEFDAKTQSLRSLDWQLAGIEGRSATDRLALDVRVRLDEPVRVRNSKMRLDAQGALVLSGTLTQSLASGQLSLREAGELTLGRAKVRITDGRVELQRYPVGTPVLDFRGMTRVSGVVMDIQARGPLDDLKLDLSSNRTDLSQTDLVTLLLTGRTASAAASQGGVVVAEELAVALGGVLQKGVGDALLIDVSPDRSLLTDDTDPTQRFNVGTRVAQNLLVIYSAALDGTEQRWIVEFNPGGGRLRFRAIAEEDNTSSFEVSDRLSFDLWRRKRPQASHSRESERLRELRFEGTLPFPDAELRSATRLHQGRRYNALQREKAAERVRAKLVEAGFLGARVDAEWLPSGTNGQAGAQVLVLRLDPGPSVELVWSGDDPGKGARREAEASWPPLATPEVGALAMARAARWRLQADRHYTASVVPEVAESDGKVLVALRVTLGPRGSGVDFGFEGNQALDARTLAKGLPRPGSRELFEALEPGSAEIASGVRLAYAGIGYLRVRVGAARAELDRSTARLKVVVPVQERGASRVAAVELPAEVRDATHAPNAATHALELKLQPDAPFDVTSYVADRDAIEAWYREQGYLEAQVRAVIEPRGDDVTIRYLAQPGPRPRVGEVRVAAGGKTRDSLVRRSVTLEEGDTIRPSQLAESRERLSELGVYRSVEVRPETRPGDDASRDLVVALSDKPDVSVEYGVRYTTDGQGGAGGAPSGPQQDKIQLAGAVELSNPFGFAWKTRAYGFVTSDRRSWGVNLDAATLFGARLRTQLFLFDDDESDTEIAGLASRVQGFTAQQSRVLLRDRSSRRWRDRLRLQWGYTFKHIDYRAAENGQNLIQGDRGFVSLALIGDERDNLTDPKRGLFWTATAELARRGLGSDVDYERVYGQLFVYRSFGPLVWAQGYRLGTVPGENPLLLLENRFHAGGPTTVRGFEQNALGPQTAEGDSLGGQAVAVLNQELRFPIWSSLRGGLFWDAGNVSATSGRFDFGDIRQSVGFGLRFMLPFGPIRLEYAWILNPLPGEPRGRLVFGLGHAF